MVLPLPLGPIRPWISPGSRLSETSSSATTPPKCFPTASRLQAVSRGSPRAALSAAPSRTRSGLTSWLRCGSPLNRSDGKLDQAAEAFGNQQDDHQQGQSVEEVAELRERRHELRQGGQDRPCR